MNGEIKLESELGRGTKTTFSIPFHKAHVGQGDLPSVGLGSDPATPGRIRANLVVSGEVSDGPSGTGDAWQNLPTELQAQAQSPLESDCVSKTETLRWKPIAVTDTTDREISQHAVDRKSIHVLVVEDK